MAKQKSFQLSEESYRVLEKYRQYCEEVNKKVGLPVSVKLSDNQLLNGALSLLEISDKKYNIFDTFELSNQ